MYKTTKHVRRFDTKDRHDMEEYEGILNDPLCSILSKSKEKETTKEFGEEGMPTHQHDNIILILEWEEKEPL